jgi:hypothetical protein
MNTPKLTHLKQAFPGSLLFYCVDLWFYVLITVIYVVSFSACEGLSFKYWFCMR